MAFTTTTSEVIEGTDLTGRTALVTGATTGLGLETATTLAGAGAAVLVGCRNLDKGDAAMAAIREVVPGAELEPAVMDLADLATVRACADAIVAGHERLDLLINNAGVMFTPEGRTADGFETQLGTNHLGHFVLTNRLIPLLRAAAPARIVNLSSAGHGFGDIRWDDPHFEQDPYDKFEAYGQSKTANILFTVELDRRLAGAGVRAYAVHPGMIMTELARHMDAGDMEELGERATRRDADRASASSGGPEFKTIPQGAATTVWAAVAPELDDRGGVYCADAEVRDEEVAAYALDPDAAQRLWTMSEELVGETFPA